MASSEGNEEAQSQYVDLSGEISNRRITENTRRAYERIMRALKQFLEVKHPENIVDGRIELPLPVRVMEEFVGSHLKKKLKGPNGEDTWIFKSRSSANLLRATLVYLHKEREVVFPPLAAQKLTDVLKGYMKKLTDLKDTGEVKQEEG